MNQQTWLPSKCNCELSPENCALNFHRIEQLSEDLAEANSLNLKFALVQKCPLNKQYLSSKYLMIKTPLMSEKKLIILN